MLFFFLSFFFYFSVLRSVSSFLRVFDFFFFTLERNREIHPKLCFAALAGIGGAGADAVRSWRGGGQRARRSVCPPWSCPAPPGAPPAAEGPPAPGAAP